ncbi:hypothetical protein [Agrococcus sp. Marseille-Q4369]|uniref:hypothetical protein n=1 Tax=Agrococcus sp. Marseille-Q4369 TaxID=2810513 RepID=UPI001B8D0CAE|nr:hypothetical protein [Agrococcus sp. Marseille-Q4369]QUW18871.1 hypothetical protein JSQ78_00345 [Agrococcus sp. Marseille-Q4369]
MTFLPIPPLPSAINTSVLFTKDGMEYRVSRTGPDEYVVHRRGATAEEYEVRLTLIGHTFDVSGRNGFVSVGGGGMTWGEIAATIL